MDSPLTPTLCSTGQTATPPRGLRLLHVIALNQGLLAVVAAGERFGKLALVGMYKDFPLPHAIPLDFAIRSVPTGDGLCVHAIHLQSYPAMAPQVNLAFVSNLGRKANLHATCRRLDQYSKPELADFSRKFGKLIGPLFASARASQELPQAYPVAPITAAARLRLEGELLNASGTAIRGWVWCPDEPARSLSIQILKSNSVIAQGPANRYCDVLRQQGKGDGGYLFDIPVPQAIQDGLRHKLKLFVPEAAQFLGREVEFQFMRPAMP